MSTTGVFARLRWHWWFMVSRIPYQLHSALYWVSEIFYDLSVLFDEWASTALDDWDEAEREVYEANPRRDQRP